MCTLIPIRYGQMQIYNLCYMYLISVDIMPELMLIRAMLSLSFFHLMPGTGARQKKDVWASLHPDTVEDFI